jgi:hypothetical protein
MTGTVKDVIEVKGRVALQYGAAGVIVIFSHDPSAPPPDVGDPVRLIRGDGWSYTGCAEDVRFEPSATASGMFLRELVRDDVPIGSTIQWGAEVTTPQAAVA